MAKVIHNRFVEIAESLSPKLTAAIQSVGPLRLGKRQDDPLAFRLCRIVTGQQLSTVAAGTIWGRVIDCAGEQEMTSFVSTTTTDVLRSCGLSAAKSKAMKAIVAADQKGLLNVANLGKLSHADRSAELTSIWGVGQWTADMISIFYFGDKDVWPGNDVTVWKTLQRLTSRRRDHAKTASMFAPNRSYLALYMYRIADAKP